MCFSCYRLPVVLQSHVCVRVTALVRRHFSQCSGLIRRGATRLTSDLESRGTPRGDSTSYNNSHSYSKTQGGCGKSENCVDKTTKGTGMEFNVDLDHFGERLSQQEIDCRALPVKSKALVSLSNEFTFKFTVSPNFDSVKQKGTALGGFPLLVHVDAPIELNEKRKLGSKGRAPCSVACTILTR